MPSPRSAAAAAAGGGGGPYIVLLLSSHCMALIKQCLTFRHHSLLKITHRCRVPAPSPIICVVRFAQCCQLNGSLHRSGGWSRWPHAGKGLKKRHPPMNQSNPINVFLPTQLEDIPSSDKLFFSSSHYGYIRGFLFLLNAFRLG